VENQTTRQIAQRDLSRIPIQSSKKHLYQRHHFKIISIDIIKITKNPAVLHDIDATKSFDLVINGITLLALRSLGFPESLMTMIGKLWSG
jgi:hypothetical protein